MAWSIQHCGPPAENRSNRKPRAAFRSTCDSGAVLEDCSPNYSSVINRIA